MAEGVLCWDPIHGCPNESHKSSCHLHKAGISALKSLPELLALVSPP